MTGAEFYTTNYESFGTNALVIADGTASIPVRTVFLAHTSGLGPQDENTCYSGGLPLAKPCSTEEGLPPYSDASQCIKQAAVACTTGMPFLFLDCIVCILHFAQQAYTFCILHNSDRVCDIGFD